MGNALCDFGNAMGNALSDLGNTLFVYYMGNALDIDCDHNMYLFAMQTVSSAPDHQSHWRRPTAALLGRLTLRSTG